MSRLYNIGAFNLTGALRWETHSTIGLLLATSSYTPDRDHEHVDDITNELSGGNYARLTTMSGRTRTRDDTNDRIVLDASDVTFPGLQLGAGTPGYLIVYDNAEAADADRELIGWVTLSSPLTPDGSNYTITFSASGIWALSTV